MMQKSECNAILPHQVILDLKRNTVFCNRHNRASSPLPFFFFQMAQLTTLYDGNARVTTKSGQPQQ